jgi:polar amino acid transport system permease protein
MARYLLYRDPAGNWHSGILLRGLFVTLRLGAWSMLLALLSGGLVGSLSAHHRGLAALPAALYINLMRNTPPLILLFLIFFFAGSVLTVPVLRLEAMVAGLPPPGRSFFAAVVAPPGHLDRMAAAVLTIGLYEGAYVAEIVRSGIESVPRSQWDASAAQGLTPWQQRRHIIAPQAVRLMLPPLTGQTISIFKTTALASVISLPELTFQSLEIMAVTRVTLELWLGTAAVYLAVSQAWAALGRRLENRCRWRPMG